MVITINGIPGSGKNVRATYLAIKHYRLTNFFLLRIFRRLLHKPIYINNVYTSYPIRLKKGSKLLKTSDVYSNRVTIFDLVPSNRFLKKALIIIDETQAFYDSEEYKDFPKEIAVFNQFHRHFDIKDIIYITQHPSRLMKKLRILCCEFKKIKVFFNIPIINLGFMYITSYFEFDDYGKYNHPKKEAKTYDVKNQLCLFFTKRVFTSYNSKYLSVLNSSSPLFNKGCFTSLSLSEAEIRYIYRDKIIS